MEIGALPKRPEDEIKRSIIIMMLQHTRNETPSDRRAKSRRAGETRGAERGEKGSPKSGGATAEKFDKRITTVRG